MRRSLSYYMGRVRRALSLHIKATRGFTGSIAMDTPWRGQEEPAFNQLPSIWR